MQKFNCFDRLKLQKPHWFYGNSLKEANRIGPAQPAMHIISLILVDTVYPDMAS